VTIVAAISESCVLERSRRVKGGDKRRRRECAGGWMRRLVPKPYGLRQLLEKFGNIRLDSQLDLEVCCRERVLITKLLPDDCHWNVLE
jgi:hypothetical protein